MLVVATQALVLEVQLVLPSKTVDIHVIVLTESLEPTVNKSSFMDSNIKFLEKN